MTERLELLAIPHFPLIQPGDDLAAIIVERLAAAGLALTGGDILVIAQKVVSKAEGRLVRLSEVTPAEQARDLAPLIDKDPRLVQVILDESNRIEVASNGVLVVEHRSGFVCANAGVDRSNVPQGDQTDTVLALLPEDSDASARRLREALLRLTGRAVAVIINDTHGRAFREGAVGVAIGVAGISALEEKRGQPDLFGYRLRVTTIGQADEIASAASLLMGQTDEGQPVVLVRGLSGPRTEGSAQQLVRPRHRDLFRRQDP